MSGKNQFIVRIAIDDSDTSDDSDDSDDSDNWHDPLKGSTHGENCLCFFHDAGIVSYLDGDKRRKFATGQRKDDDRERVYLTQLNDWNPLNLNAVTHHVFDKPKELEKIILTPFTTPDVRSILNRTEVPWSVDKFGSVTNIDRLIQTLYTAVKDETYHAKNWNTVVHPMAPVKTNIVSTTYNHPATFPTSRLVRLTDKERKNLCEESTVPFAADGKRDDDVGVFKENLLTSKMIAAITYEETEYAKQYFPRLTAEKVMPHTILYKCDKKCTRKEDASALVTCAFVEYDIVYSSTLGQNKHFETTNIKAKIEEAKTEKKDNQKPAKWNNLVKETIRLAEAISKSTVPMIIDALSEKNLHCDRDTLYLLIIPNKLPEVSKMKPHEITKANMIIAAAVVNTMKDLLA
jgi:hypothetical protein